MEPRRARDLALDLAFAVVLISQAHSALTYVEREQNIYAAGRLGSVQLAGG
jgi:hypothetical protein